MYLKRVALQYFQHANHVKKTKNTVGKYNITNKTSETVQFRLDIVFFILLISTHLQ